MLLLLLLSVLLAYRLQKFIYRRFWDRNLQVQTFFTDSYVYEGDASSLREEIANDKKLPLPALEVRLSISRDLAFTGEAKANTNVTDLTYKRDVFSFLFHQKVIHTLPFVCRKRGFYQISNVEVLGYDLFFSTKYYLNAAQQTQLYVYPAQVDAGRIRLICQTVSGMVLVQNRLYPDPFEFSGIREYRRDPMHHINWKASARSGSLMVNQFDSTTSIRTTVILDVEDSHILRSEPLTEESIRIASSLAARMVKEHMELRLVSNAVLYEDAHGGSDTFKDMDSSADIFRNMHSGLSAPANTCRGSDAFKNTDSRIDISGNIHGNSGVSGIQNPQTQEERMFFAWHAKPGAGRIHELNRRLARIDTHRTVAPISQLLQKEAANRPAGQIYVLISKNQDSVSMELLRALSSGNEILWVIPMAPGEALLHANAPGIRMMRWEVNTV